MGREKFREDSKVAKKFTTWQGNQAVLYKGQKNLYLSYKLSLSTHTL